VNVRHWQSLQVLRINHWESCAKILCIFLTPCMPTPLHPRVVPIGPIVRGVIAFPLMGTWWDATTQVASHWFIGRRVMAFRIFSNNHRSPFWILKILVSDHVTVIVVRRSHSVADRVYCGVRFDQSNSSSNSSSRNIYTRRSKSKSHYAPQSQLNKMSLQQFLELADCRVGLTQWSQQSTVWVQRLGRPGHQSMCECARPHRWKHRMNEADAASDIWERQVGSHQTSGEVLNHSATCVWAEPT